MEKLWCYGLSCLCLFSLFEVFYVYIFWVDMCWWVYFWIIGFLKVLWILIFIVYLVFIMCDDYYEVLGVLKMVIEEDIRKGYWK